MKTLKATGLLLFAAIAFVAVATPKAVTAQPGVRVSFQLFYDQLAPYGEWVDDPEYGYIWLPDAGPDFQPYATNGHWVMTNYGNTWVSNYSWGWAPFHYGRWIYTDYYGWAWVPGYEWGPAWVSWRSGGGYYGWAPLGPRMSININIGIPHHHWVFVPQRYLTSPRIYNYYIPYRNRVTIFNRTTIINNTYVYNNRTYVSGPRRAEIERVTRSRISVRDVRSTNRPGRARVDSRSVNLYRPDIDRDSRTSARPSRVTSASAVRNTANSRGEVRSASSRNQAIRSADRSRSRTNTVTAPRTRDLSDDAITPRAADRRSNSTVRSSRPAAAESSARGVTRPARVSSRESGAQNRSVRPQSRASRPAADRNTVQASSRTHSRNDETRAARPVGRTQSRPAVSANRSENRRNSVSRGGNSRAVERGNTPSRRDR